jgi:cell division protein DivIC
MRTARLLNLLFLVCLLVVGSFAGTFAYQRYEKLVAARSTEAETARQLEQLEEKTRAKRTELARLQHDPEYVEKVIRQKLNYAKENEVVFKFEASDR